MAGQRLECLVGSSQGNKVLPSSAPVPTYLAWVCLPFKQTSTHLTTRDRSFKFRDDIWSYTALLNNANTRLAPLLPLLHIISIKIIKNFGAKKILWPKEFLVHNIFGSEKFLVKKNDLPKFWSWKILGKKKLGFKNILVPKIFWYKNLWV